MSYVPPLGGQWQFLTSADGFSILMWERVLSYGLAPVDRFLIVGLSMGMCCVFSLLSGLSAQALVGPSPTLMTATLIRHVALFTVDRPHRDVGCDFVTDPEDEP